MEKRNLSLKANILINTLYQLLSVITPFITAPYISRILGPDNVGIYSFTYSIVMYFSLFAALGVDSYGCREVSRSRDDSEQLSKVFIEIESIKILSSLICLLVWWGYISLIETYKIYYKILTFYLFNTMFDISWFYNGIEQFKYTVTKNTVIKIVVTVLIFFVVKTKNDLGIYMLLLGGSTFLGSLSMWVSLHKFIHRVNIRELHLRKHVKETFVYFIPTIATSVYTILDKTFIGVITKDPSQNGYYEQANKIISIIKALTFSSINTVLESRISYLFKENKLEEIRNRINKSICFIFFMGFGFCFGLLGMSDSFVPVFFGTDYLPVSGLLKLLSPIIIIIGLSNCLGSQYYTPAGKRKKSAMFIIIGSVVNILLNILLISKIGCRGAIISSLIAEGIITVLYISFCDKVITMKRLILSGWKDLVAGVIMYLSFFATINLHLPIISKLIIRILLGAGIYIISLVILRDTFVLGNLKLLKTRFKLKGTKYE